MRRDSTTRAHEEWIGLCQPVGLVVAPTALETCGAVLESDVRAPQEALRRLVAPNTREEQRARVPTFKDLARTVLDWTDTDLIALDDVPESARATLTHHLEDFGETLRPTFAVAGGRDEKPFIALVKELPAGQDLDDAKVYETRRWQASAQARFERLLWETGIPIGILTNGTDVRLLSVPRGEVSGHVTLPIDAMCETAGRPILAALRLLLGADRMFSLGAGQRLPALLAESRKYQSVVSTALAEQVLAALHELVDGFQAADQDAHGLLLADVKRKAPDEIYGGLLSTILRLVFVLFAEDRNLMPDDPVYREGYSLTRLFEKLREDAGMYPDTMDLRFGAWGQLLALFRLIFDGASYKDPDSGRTATLPSRQGKLFNPDTYPFLEGRARGVARVAGATVTPPRVSDGTVYRVLENLMLLEGQRLSYRTLDVEQVGSVYEALMGFSLEEAKAPSIAIKPDHVVIDLNDLLAEAPARRAAWLKDKAGTKLNKDQESGVKDARDLASLTDALKKLIPKGAREVPPAAIYLQPTEERRRSGSHYTPRTLTEPIVRTALRPIFERLGEKPSPSDILSLKVCDPAMGSGAFLVESVRQLSAALVSAWATHTDDPETPFELPADETQAVHAARLVAQRCIYGVDKNPFAVELAKLSLWLATFAKDHPFTFVDHSLRHGDTLVGLTKAQIADFTWEKTGQRGTWSQWIEDPIKEAEIDRGRLSTMGDTRDNAQKRALLRRADDALDTVRLIGDLAVQAFFSAEKPKDREKARTAFAGRIEAWLSGDDAAPPEDLVEIAEAMRRGKRPIVPFHWEIEFPEVFGRKNGGFDVFVGNPPFAGKNTLINSSMPHILDWLKAMHEGAHGNADLVAHFFRRAYSLLCDGGTFGLIATNTIGQGDTRATGLTWLRTNGATIFGARRRMKWPGVAAVIVSVVHVHKGAYRGAIVLDETPVDRITAFLFAAGPDDSPVPVAANAGRSFIGSYVLGMGFTFDDTNPEATPIAEMQRLIASDPRNQEVIFPYLGGEELNTSPTHAHHRYVINFGERDESECRQRWPDLMRIIEEKVKPERLLQGDRGAKEKWWQFIRVRNELAAAIRNLDCVITIARHQPNWCLSIQPSGSVFSEACVVVAEHSSVAFSLLQSRLHELWARFLGSSMKDDLRYTPSDCFETFPFPRAWESNATLEDIGKRYYDYRAALMVKNDEGLTKTYNRFHDPDERSADILELRRLHDEMDRAVLDAYGWSDLQPTCTFLLDYEEEDDDDVGARRRKKPWRYRWPDDVRDLVLGRLLELNRVRAEEEKILGKEATLGTAAGGSKKKVGGKKKVGAKKKGGPMLPGME
jgi:hypothetical protein